MKLDKPDVVDTSDAHGALIRHGFAEKCGLFVGARLAPLTGALSRARDARMFHPDGVVYRASVTPEASEPTLRALAERLEGDALVRFSSALWRQDREWPDVLGAALRFSGRLSLQDVNEQPNLAQDLLLATIRFPWTMPLAPLATNFRSFLWNHYHAVSPFEVEGIGPVKLRLRSPRLRNASSESRADHLRYVTAAGRAVYELQVRRLSVSALARRWQTLARVTLRAPWPIDQAALRFSPFHDRAGIHPIGFVHAIRVAAYAASQAARPATQATTEMRLPLSLGTKQT